MNYVPTSERMKANKIAVGIINKINTIISINVDGILPPVTTVDIAQ